MKVLAIDCSAVAAGVAVTEDGKVLSSAYTNIGLTHSQTLVPMLDSVLKQANLTLSDISCYAINAGPGSFTGVRIGVATLKGLTEFSDEPNIYSLSTLESMAYIFAGVKNCTVCSAMDARCKQVYTALFRVEGETVTRLTPDEALFIADLKDRLERIEGPIVFVGDGASLCYNFYLEILPNVMLAPEQMRYQNAVSVAHLAEAKIKDGEQGIRSSELLPVYLRAPQAERELKKKQNKETEKIL